MTLRYITDNDQSTKYKKPISLKMNLSYSENVSEAEDDNDVIGIYEGEIGPFNINDTVTAYVEAFDKLGNNYTSPEVEFEVLPIQEKAPIENPEVEII